MENRENRTGKSIILIPAYKAADSLKTLLAEIIEYTSDVLVVDDGSFDGTNEVVRSYSLNYIVHKVNLGKGAALQTGFKWAKENGYKFVITMDADGQHLPIHLPQIVESSSDVTIGARAFSFKEMPLHRIISNKLTSVICSIVLFRKVKDSQSGYRKINLELTDGFSSKINGFQFETELLLYLLKNKKHSLNHVSIQTVYTNGVSYIRHFHDTISFIKVILRFLWTTK